MTRRISTIDRISGTKPNRTMRCAVCTPYNSLTALDSTISSRNAKIPLSTVICPISGQVPTLASFAPSTPASTHMPP